MENNSTRPLPVEPYDKVWGVGVSGLTDEPSPFPRVNRLLKWTKERDSTADSQRAVIVTEGYKKYAHLPQNVKWGLILRDIFTNVSIRIWPDELIVGELAAEPCSAPIYPEFSIDWLAREFKGNVMEARTNDRYVISRSVKDDIIGIDLPVVMCCKVFRHNAVFIDSLEPVASIDLWGIRFDAAHHVGNDNREHACSDMVEHFYNGNTAAFHTELFGTLKPCHPCSYHDDLPIHCAPT